MAPTSALAAGEGIDSIAAYRRAELPVSIHQDTLDHARNRLLDLFLVFRTSANLLTLAGETTQPIGSIRFGGVSSVGLPAGSTGRSLRIASVGEGNTKWMSLSGSILSRHGLLRCFI